MGPFNHERYNPSWRRAPDPGVWRMLAWSGGFLAILALAFVAWVQIIGYLARMIAP